MGYYIETGMQTHNKAEIIAKTHNGKVSTFDEAKLAMTDPEKGVVVVVNNGFFEAAGFAFDMGEFEAFTDMSDPRPKQFVIMERKLAAQLNTKTLKGPNGIRIELDKNQVDRDDPGNGTPALVFKIHRNVEYSSTFWCAQGEGELLGNTGALQLTGQEMDWLNKQEDELTKFLYE